MSPLLITLLIILTLLLVAGLGLRLPPRPFPPFPQPAGPLETVPLPDGLPPPVVRYLRGIYGQRLPLIHSAVITGRGRVRPAGPISFPARYRFTHRAGHDYRHYIEATFFGLPILKVNEWYRNGQARLELPFGTVADSSRVDRAANQGLWAETVSLPALFATDPRAQWTTVDQETALLSVPGPDGERQQFVVRFDPQSGGLLLLETMRFREADSPRKSLWIAATVPGPRVQAGGVTLDAAGSALWLEQGRPWATFIAEEIVYNVDVDDYLDGRGI